MAALTQSMALVNKAAFGKSATGRVRASKKMHVCAVAAGTQTGTRPLWLPGITPPKHLDGSLPGDFGFDPANLGADPAALNWFRNAELVNGRTAMAAVAGILIPDVLKEIGGLPKDFPEWFDAGKVVQENSPIPYGPLLMIELFLCGFVEVKRGMDILKPGSQKEPGFLGLEGSLGGTGVSGYPGGPFDPLGLSKTDQYSRYQWSELRNGRLAMVAFLAFNAQYVATGKGPVECLVAHV